LTKRSLFEICYVNSLLGSLLRGSLTVGLSPMSTSRRDTLRSGVERADGQLSLSSSPPKSWSGPCSEKYPAFRRRVELKHSRPQQPVAPRRRSPPRSKSLLPSRLINLIFEVARRCFVFPARLPSPNFTSSLIYKARFSAFAFSSLEKFKCQCFWRRLTHRIRLSGLPFMFTVYLHGRLHL